MTFLFEKYKHKYKHLQLLLSNLLRKIDIKHVAFCPVGLTDADIIDFAEENRDKKLRILGVYFTYQLTEAYQIEGERRTVVEFLNFVCLTAETKVIDEGMTLFEALEIVNHHYPSFFSKLMYAMYSEAKAFSDSVNFRITPSPHEVLKLMAVEFSTEFQKDEKTDEYPSDAVVSFFVSFFEKAKYNRPPDWFTK